MNCQDELKRLQVEYDLLKHKYESTLNEQLKMDAIYELFNKYTITSETDLNGIITYVSQPFLDISGYTKEELIGKHHSIVRHEDMPREAFTEMWKTITAKKVWRGEVKNKTKDGGFYWVDSIVFPVLNHEQHIESYKSIRIDITDRKKLDNAVHDLLDEDSSLIKF